VFGQTKYKTTTPFGINGFNIIFERTAGNYSYCAGCNGSFLLDFTSTTVGNSLGVFGVGFDILNDTDYFAYVTFGDDSTEDFSLATQEFWGITSDKSIKSINIGLQGGGATINGSIVIDNLTIGSKSTPESNFILGILACASFSFTSLLKRKQPKP
jgi:hypothetical protein